MGSITSFETEKLCFIKLCCKHELPIPPIKNTEEKKNCGCYGGRNQGNLLTMLRIHPRSGQSMVFSVVA